MRVGKVAAAVGLVAPLSFLVAAPLAAFTALSFGEPAASKAPLSDLFARLSGLPTYAIDGLAAAAVVNGALIQIIMASRVFYGSASQG